MSQTGSGERARFDVAPAVRAVWDRSWATRWAFPLIPIYNIQLGLVLLLGDPSRVSGPSFAPLREFGVANAGAVFLAVGVLYGLAAFVSARALLNVGLAVAVAHLLLASTFITALLTVPPPPPPVPFAPPPPAPALTGIGTYLFVAVVHFIGAFIYGRRGPLGEGSSA